MMKRVLGALFLLLLTGCVPTVDPTGPDLDRPHLDRSAFIAADGAVLPMRSWLPATEPDAVVVALHGMDDYRAFFDIPGSRLAAAGIAAYAYDQRGFGQAPDPGAWFGATAMQDDLLAFLRVIAARYPGKKLFALGESMGGAVVMTALARTDARPPPTLAGAILVAPAVWSRDTMPWYQSAALWIGAHTVPWMALTGNGLKIQATDNVEVLRRMSRDPLFIKETRIGSIEGLCDLMDDAMRSAPALHIPSLVLIADKDQIIPPEVSRAMAATLPASASVKSYPLAYHMMLRDLRGDIPTEDIIDWIRSR
jgi:alpha-beta hydrolase superfamily lysophospholipase